ncbi:MAG: pilus assembly protein [Planctomycetota bacterium]|nr:MAG: pilus assembly protein [Planctomycetota bacterium]
MQTRSLFRLRQSQSGERRGVTTVEVALTFPILMLILTLSIEAARLNTLRNTLENAAYEGARRAIVPGASSTDIQTSVLSILRSINAKNAVVTINPATLGNSTGPVTVTVDVPIASNSWVGQTSSRHMIRACTLLRERTR